MILKCIGRPSNVVVLLLVLCSIVYASEDTNETVFDFVEIDSQKTPTQDQELRQTEQSAYIPAHNCHAEPAAALVKVVFEKESMKIPTWRQQRLENGIQHIARFFCQTGLLKHHTQVSVTIFDDADEFRAKRRQLSGLPATSMRSATQHRVGVTKGWYDMKSKRVLVNASVVKFFFENIVFHEASHSLTDSIGLGPNDRLPGWFDEGLAEHFETLIPMGRRPEKVFEPRRRLRQLNRIKKLNVGLRKAVIRPKQKVGSPKPVPIETIADLRIIWGSLFDHLMKNDTDRTRLITALKKIAASPYSFSEAERLALLAPGGNIDALQLQWRTSIDEQIEWKTQDNLKRERLGWPIDRPN